MPNARSYSLPSIARALGVSNQAARMWVRDGKLLAHRGGPRGENTWRVTQVNLDDFIRRWSTTRRGKALMLNAGVPKPRKRANPTSAPRLRCPSCHILIPRTRYYLYKLHELEQRSPRNSRAIRDSMVSTVHEGQIETGVGEKEDE